MSRRLLLSCSLGLAAVAVLPASCSRGNLASTMATPPSRAAIDGQARCAVTPSQLRPLVVEWPAADRASLEARLRRGMVAVRYEGCAIEVLRHCQVPGAYTYAGITRKREQVKIKNADELYAQLPVGAARLEAKLARAGELRVDMTLVGMLEADRVEHTLGELEGPCEGATHVITGVQVGAYNFFAGGEAEIGAGGQVAGAGAGAKSEASQEVLSSDGDGAACEAAREADARPPEGCGALLRVEVAPISSAKRAPACPEGSAWDGSRCVATEVQCPAGSSPAGGRCVGEVAAREPAREPAKEPAKEPVSDPDDAVCEPLCDRQLACDAEANGMALPEGKALARLEGMCMRQCRWMATDMTRPQLRRCAALTTCAELRSCLQPQGTAGI